MSRTRKDMDKRYQKELWSRRPYRFQDNVKFWRKLCARKERQLDKQIVKDELKCD